VTRPALTWLALWLGIASAVAVGIVAGFLLLRLLAPDVAIAASRAAPPSPDANAVSDLVLAPANEAPNPSPTRRVALPPATAKPSPASIVPAARSGTRVAGTASWWSSFGPGIYAALPGYVAGTHVTIRVWSGELHVDAPVITSCGCFVGTQDERIVDVSPGILAALGLDPGRGLYPVSIEVLP
jgi:hypothetical protein